MRFLKFAPALLALAAITVAVAFFAGSASAANIIVTRNDDPAVDGCDVNGCSLREAVGLGNTTAGVQVIEIGDMDIDLTSTINITGDMTILGLNSGDSVIRTGGGNEVQIFSIAGGGNVTFERVWIYGASASGPGQCGGAIYNSGTLQVTNARVAKNFVDASGAGICNLGTATLNKSYFSANNSDSHVGGAIYNSGTITIVDSTITQNDAIEGGGIFNANTGTMTVTGSTITDNTAESGCDDCDSGGGIATEGELTIEYSTVSTNTADNGAGMVSRGDTTIRRSTFSQNTGGAINNSDGLMTISRSTIANNTSTSFTTAGIAGVSNNDRLNIISSTIINNPAFAYQYGGVFTGAQASTTYKASVIGDNGPGNCHTGGDQTSNGYNVFFPLTSACKSDGNGDQEVGSGNMGALANNGGPTQTSLPQGGSPAVNNGGPGCPAPDQRGALIADTMCDSGAVELSGTPPTPTLAPTATPGPAGYPMGDVSCNDSVGSEDVAPSLKLAAKLAVPDDCGRDQLGCFDYEGACYPPWVDTTCDNKMRADDVLPIVAHLAGAEVDTGGCTPVGESIGFGCLAC